MRLTLSAARDPSVNQSFKSPTSDNAHSASSHSSLVSSIMDTMWETTNGGNSSLRDSDNLFHLHWKSPFVVSDKNSTDPTVPTPEDAPNPVIVWKPNPIHKTVQVMIKTQTRLQSVVRRRSKSFLTLLRLHGWTKIIALSNGYHLLNASGKSLGKNWNRWMDAAFDRIGKILSRRRRR
jgi:hypothetical protein